MAVVLCIASLGCSVESVTPRGPRGPIPLAELPAEMRAALCEIVARCPFAATPGARSAAALLGDRFCDDITREAVAHIRDLTASVQAGRARYDSAAAGRCLDRLTSVCLATNSDPFVERCRDVFRGTVAIGSGCFDDEECDDGWCEGTMPGYVNCSGTCRARTAVGRPCRRSAECQSPAGDAWVTCANLEGGMETGPTRYCQAVRLGATAGLGQPCGLVGNDGTTSPCAQNLWCPGSRSTCQALIAQGALCPSANSLCQGLDVCQRRPTGGYACAPLVLREEGQSCDEFARIRCNDYHQLLCDEGRCRRVGDGSEGSVCSLPPQSESGFAREVLCDEGMACGTDGRCQRFQPVGAACDQRDQCESYECVHSPGMRACAPRTCNL